MNIKLELLRGYVADIINSHIKDFEVMDEIVRGFERYDVSAGNRHDF